MHHSTTQSDLKVLAHHIFLSTTFTRFVSNSLANRTLCLILRITAQVYPHSMSPPSLARVHHDCSPYPHEPHQTTNSDLEATTKGQMKRIAKRCEEREKKIYFKIQVTDDVTFSLFLSVTVLCQRGICT